MLFITIPIYMALVLEISPSLIIDNTLLAYNDLIVVYKKY